MKQSYLQKKFIRTKDKWIEINKAEKHTQGSKLDAASSFKTCTNQPKKSDQTYRHCIEYWDDIKLKYKYNHLYKKRILKIKQEDLQDSIDNKCKITQLLNDNGDIQALYSDRSKDIDVRGEGVWQHLNGLKMNSIDEEAMETPCSIEKSQSEAGKDIIDEIKRCLFKENDKLFSEDLQLLDSTTKLTKEAQKDTNKCIHITAPEHKKLFTVPECIEIESSSKDSSSEYPAEFELCMREFHNLRKPIKIEDEKTEEEPKVEDPWCKLKRCQIEKYGFSDLPVCLDEDTTSEEEFTEEDFYEKIINNIMEKDVRVKGAKIKIKQILGDENMQEHGNLRQARVTITGKDGQYIQGMDIKEEIEPEDEGERFMRIVLQILAGEWTTMGIFLKELAENTRDFKPIVADDQQPLRKRILGPLGKNVHKMVREIAGENIDNEESRDIKVDIKFSNLESKCYSSSPLFSKEQQDKILDINYREKIDYKLLKDKKTSKTLSKQTAVKKELNLGKYEERYGKIHVDPPHEDPQPEKFCCQLHKAIDKSKSSDSKIDEPEKTYHRGLVELMSGSKYAGSWNRLGMEGCGIYISPGGTAINGNMSDGVLNGPATVYLPNGIIIAGAFNKGKFHSPKIQFGDGLEYKQKEWDYLKETKKLSKSKIKLSKPILDREIPDGCYDTGEGFYNPATKQIYHPVTNAPIRAVSEREEKWIVSVCRGATPKCVSLDEHFYEKVEIPTVKDKKKRAELLKDEYSWSDCQSPLYNAPTDDVLKDRRLSPDTLIHIDKKSRPVQELWDSIRCLTGGQRAKVAVPFAYEKAIEYTCTEASKIPCRTEDGIKMCSKTE